MSFLVYRHWFWSAICVAGTTDTFNFLKQKMYNEEVNYLESVLILTFSFHLTEIDNITLKAAAVSTLHSNIPHFVIILLRSL